MADNISIWMPGALKVDPWPQEGMVQFEWYVPVNATRHVYLQTLGRRVGSESEGEAFRQEVRDKWIDLALDGFNDDDVWAREATEEFYRDDRGWVEERLFETDLAIVEWRSLASQAQSRFERPSTPTSTLFEVTFRHGLLCHPQACSSRSAGRRTWRVGSRTSRAPSSPSSASRRPKARR